MNEVIKKWFNAIPQTKYTGWLPVSIGITWLPVSIGITWPIYSVRSRRMVADALSDIGPETV